MAFSSDKLTRTAMGNLEKEPPTSVIQARQQTVANYLGTWAEGFTYYPVTDKEELHSVFFVYGIRGDIPGSKISDIQNRFPGATVRIITDKGTRLFVPKDESRFLGMPIANETARAKVMPVRALLSDLLFYLAILVLVLYASFTNSFGLFGG